jgi:hypothetical protein
MVNILMVWNMNCTYSTCTWEKSHIFLCLYSLAKHKNHVFFLNINSHPLTPPKKHSSHRPNGVAAWQWRVYSMYIYSLKANYQVCCCPHTKYFFTRHVSVVMSFLNSLHCCHGHVSLPNTSSGIRKYQFKTFSSPISPCCLTLPETRTQMGPKCKQMT